MEHVNEFIRKNGKRFRLTCQKLARSYNSCLAAVIEAKEESTKYLEDFFVSVQILISLSFSGNIR